MKFYKKVKFSLNIVKIVSFLLVILIGLPVFCEEGIGGFQNIINTKNCLENKMEDYNQKKLLEWQQNPFIRPESDRSFSAWTDPLAYNSYWYMYYPPKVEESFDKDKFKLDKVLFYHSPQLAGSLTPIGFSFDNMKYRFYIGVGFLWNGYFMMYGKGGTQLYGTHLFLDSVIQVEPFIDFIYKDNLRIRLTPIRHICYHMSGDILGDDSLHVLEGKGPDGTGEKFKDVGFEQVHASVNYHWGWFNFYGGIAAAVTNFSQSNYVNLAYFYTGTEARIPIWGNMDVIAGVHIGGNYDRLNTVQRVMDGNKYICVDSKYELTPIISAGIGFGIKNWILGFKFDYARARQIYSMDKRACRMGLSACFIM